MMTSEADTTSFGFSQLAPILPLPSSSCPMPTPPWPMEAGEMDVALSEPDGLALETALESALGIEGDLTDLLSSDMNGSRGGVVEVHKKARHNLTERARVDRLNKLFFKLSVALDDPDPAAPDAALNGPDSPLLSASRKGLKGERSKAEVIEAALSLITELRQKVASYEEQMGKAAEVSTAASSTADTASTKSEIMSDVTDLD